jgi:hypothetical protein
MADEAAEYWSEFEKRTGEKVEARSIGEWYERSGDPGVWGLLVLTDKCFRFNRIKSDNWLASLFRGFGSKKAEGPEPVDIVIPRENLVAVLRPRRGLWAKLLGPAFPRFSVRSRGEEGEILNIFSADPATGILEALERAIPGS